MLKIIVEFLSVITLYAEDNRGIFKCNNTVC